MAAQGRADGARLVIQGGSAGGYTTLAALVSTDVFAVGSSHFGISDLEAMARDTHKFESRYLDSLVAPYPAGRRTYVERSPITHVDRLTAPMILFQGLEDRVVPPSQAQEMAAAVRAKGLPVALLEFEGEGHGFRAAQTVTRVHEAEAWFLARVLGYEPADDLDEPPVVIDNL
jgi:dipeptidyl aminopeptidase/acylaminoacyl peptidase